MGKPQQYDRVRIDVPDGVRIACSNMAREAMRMTNMVGGHWTTEESLAQAHEALCVIAENALTARRLILADIARRKAEAAEPVHQHQTSEG